LFWLKISDLVEDLRRKKVEADNDAAWAMANAQDLARIPVSRPNTGPLGENPVNGVEGLESWWDLEPIGQINLKFNFSTYHCLRLLYWLVEPSHVGSMTVSLTILNVR
jgi:classical protein kinase C